MGRALFSQKFTPEPAIRTEPDPGLVPHPLYSKWSVWNDFDPDSDEFFKDAEYEAFIEPTVNVVPADDDMPPLLDDAESSSSSSDGSDTDRTSLMAVGSDDPATLIATAYPSLPRRWSNLDDSTSTSTGSITPAEPVSPVAEAPPVHDVPDDTSSRAPSAPLPVFSNHHLRGFSDLTLDAEIIESAGSPPLSSSFMSTPSPATSVSPLLYNWRRFIGNSPSAPRGPVGPLSNTAARMSLSRIPPVPARVRIEGFSV